MTTLVGWLVARLAAAVGDLPAPEAPPDEVRRIADEVLADPAYRWATPGMAVRARDWVVEQLAGLLARILSSAGGGPLGWAVVAVMVVVATVAAVHLVRSLRPDAGDPHGGSGLGGPRRPATDWLADASASEAAGDWRAGLRCRYRALVAALAARGLVREVPGRTAGEYRAAVARAAPAAASDFDGATSLFELAWYGHADVGVDEVRRFEDLAARVLAVPGGRR